MSEIEFEDLLYESRGHIATITINRPEVRNALRTETYMELRQAFIAAGEDHSVGVVVLRGAGGQAFSAGGDVRGQGKRDQAAGRRHLQRVLDLGTAMRNCGKPVIAAVEGFCVGAGHELHLMCDITISADSGRFGQVGPKVGMVPVWGATQILPRIVGEKLAREMIYTCKLYSAEEALSMRLVNRVVPVAELDAAVDELCQTLIDRSPQSLRIAKLSLNHAVDAMWPSFLEGIEMVSQLYGSAEQVEGATAFLEKRKPDYRKFRQNADESNRQA